MTLSSKPDFSNRRVLIIGTDGLRPDSVDPALMPTCAKLMERGTLFTSFHAAYPSETRVSMTTLTTGVYPGRHGVVSNLMCVQGFGEDGLLQTGNDRHLLAYRQAMLEPFILHPTLGDRLHRHGKRLAVAASSSPGASLLWNLNHPELVINPSSVYGTVELEEVHRQLGDVPEEQTRVKKERALWATRSLINNHLKNEQNQVMVLWLSEPDASQHDYGIGSPEHREALQVVDECVAEVLQAIEREGLNEVIDIMWISDHGHSTIQAQGSLQGHMQRAAQELKLQTRFMAAGYYIYAVEEVEETPTEVKALIGWLQSQDWCGLVFAREAMYSDLPNVHPLEILLGSITHERAPLLVVQPKWDNEPNEYGVPGITGALTSSSKLQSSHGTVSPYDMHAFCLGVGSSFKKGYVSDITCGIVDIAPTVCHLIGLSAESGFDGRVLAEGIVPERVDMPLSRLKAVTKEIGSQQNRLGVRLIDVNGTTYIEGYKK
ncbi:alkaline phosphatase family protein [Paenibacillus sp. CGMCC 1.16610]|uniref:Alkaline phosphatase family protein n=1 Tax=Paenibacillus anseongense TaxID=2682845 RepID=A0ABW9U9J1_9BACL|nr:MULTISPECIES: nucleotide pyrophosphatase/phosphodiesterase family protein [Paenibacillus]MBA2940281.1 alkaline phosphatase family protein [Paenibacillus sp. CGMCC 1.16610]MVQ35458.1 alkaline phosphatase family protein [Paenibacillus anseongense]